MVFTVFFNGEITPCAFWLMPDMNSTAVPLTVGSPTGLWVFFLPDISVCICYTEDFSGVT